MPFYELRSGERSITATTDTWTSSEVVQGEIRKVEYITTGTMTVRANTLREDSSTADEYITGGVTATDTAVTLTCNTGKTNCYPVRNNTAVSDNSEYAEGADESASRTPLVVNSPISVTATLSSTTTGTWEAIVTYQK